MAKGKQAVATAAKGNGSDEKDIDYEALYEQFVFEDEGGSLVVDMEGVQEAKFELIPKGTYSAVIDQVDLEKSKTSGYQMFKLILKLEDEPYQKRKFYNYISFSPNALPFSKAALMRIDPETFSGKFKPQDVADSGTLLGKKVRVKIGTQEYQGETRNNVQQVLAAIDAGNAGGGGAEHGGDLFFGQ